MNYYLVHRSHPGNPWGPFGARQEAEALRAKLIEHFADNYKVVKSE